VIQLLEQSGIQTISGGSELIPCIRGTQDMRNIIDVSILCGLTEKISFLITTECSIATLGEAYGIKSFVISDTKNLTIDGRMMMDSNQIVNYIETEINKKNK
jgi:hypothetical protein